MGRPRKRRQASLNGDLLRSVLDTEKAPANAPRVTGDVASVPNATIASSNVTTTETNPLKSWLNQNPSFPIGTTTVPSAGSNSQNSVGSPSPQAKLSEPLAFDFATPTIDAKPPGATLSAEERNRFHGLLSGIVTRANVVTVGLAVKTFGRRLPGEPSEKDMQLLEKAWETQLSIWFASTDVPPYALILAASVGMGLGMWAEGEPLPPKVKDDKRTGHPTNPIPSP